MNLKTVGHTYFNLFCKSLYRNRLSVLLNTHKTWKTHKIIYNINKTF